MGETRQLRRLSNAVRRCAAGGLAARSDLTRFWRDGRGATSIEYAVIGAPVFLVIVTAVTTFASKTTNLVNMISDTISAAIGG